MIFHTYQAFAPLSSPLSISSKIPSASRNSPSEWLRIRRRISWDSTMLEYSAPWRKLCKFRPSSTHLASSPVQTSRIPCRFWFSRINLQYATSCALRAQQDPRYRGASSENYRYLVLAQAFQCESKLMRIGALSGSYLCPFRWCSHKRINPRPTTPNDHLWENSPRADQASKSCAR